MEHEHEHVPDPAEGLSTEDLAEPRRRTGPPDREVRDGRAPAFPGESTAPGAMAATGQPTGTPDRATAASAGAETPPLLATDEEEGFRARWQRVQNEFVDDPRDAVNTADALVADVMRQLATTFAEHKQELEGQWNRGEQADTEDLRVALQQYRSFFNRLLST
ncbi:hypothetical protein ACWGJX_19735 [Streptomyces sp. NPDC054775]